MTVLSGLIMILATALLASVLTLLLALVCWRAFLQKRLDAKLEEAANRLKERVKEGVTDAGRELLPAFRQEVEAGFREALTHGITESLIDKTAGAALRTGATLVEQGLNLVRAAPPPGADRKEPPP